MRDRALMLPFIVLGLTSPAPAQVLVTVPNVYANAEGPGSTSVPIHVQGNPWTFQLVLHQNQLTGLIGQDLTGLRYRHSAVEGIGYPLQTTTWSDYRIRIGPAVAPGLSTGTFANNFTAPPSPVRAGPFTAASGSWPNLGPGDPNPWGPEITFDTSYRYAGGHLALLITHPGSDNPSINGALLDAAGMATPGQGTDFRFWAGTGFDAPTGVSSNFLPVVQFTAVPEPAGWMFSVIVMGLGAARKRVAWRTTSP